MQVVIKIHERDYQAIVKSGHVPYGVLDAIMKGKILPKGHGDLIDRQALQNAMEKDIRKAMSFVDLTDFVWLAPTIVEAEVNADDK